MRVREGIQSLYKPVLTRHREETFAMCPFSDLDNEQSLLC